MRRFPSRCYGLARCLGVGRRHLRLDAVQQGVQRPFNHWPETLARPIEIELVDLGVEHRTDDGTPLVGAQDSVARVRDLGQVGADEAARGQAINGLQLNQMAGKSKITPATKRRSNQRGCSLGDGFVGVSTLATMVITSINRLRPVKNSIANHRLATLCIFLYHWPASQDSAFAFCLCGSKRASRPDVSLDGLAMPIEPPGAGQHDYPSNETWPRDFCFDRMREVATQGIS